MGFNIVKGEPDPPGQFILSSYILHTYDLNPNPIAWALIPLLGSTVGCVDCKLKFPTRRTTKNMLRDHSSLPLDAQCRAAEEELGQRVRVDHLLLV